MASNQRHAAGRGRFNFVIQSNAPRVHHSHIERTHWDRRLFGSACLLGASRVFAQLLLCGAISARMTAQQKIAPAWNNQPSLRIGIALWPASILCACVAIFVPTKSWAAWFTHPLTGSPADHLPGARLFRIMLVVMAAALAAWPFIMRALDPKARRRLSSDAPNSARLAPAPGALDAAGGSCARRRTTHWLLILFIILAMLPRLARISESLWYDEIASWLSYGVAVTSPGPIVGNYYDPVNHVFHTLLSWCSVNALEGALGSEISLRLPALLFSLLTVPIMFGFVREAAGPRTALIAAFLTAILPVSVLEGVEARGYSLMIAFSALATRMLLRAVRTGNKWTWLAYAAACTLGIWSQFVTVFIPIGHALWITMRTLRTRDWRSFLHVATSLLLAAIATLTLVSPLLPEFLKNRDVFVASRGTEPTLFGAEGLHTLLQLGGAWAWWASIPGLALLILGEASVTTYRQARVQASLAPAPASFTCCSVAIASLICLPLFLLTISLGGLWLYARFTFFALPGAILLIAVGIEALWIRNRIAALAAIIVVFAVSVADLATRPPKQPLRDAMLYVVEHAEDQHPGVRVLGLAHEVMRMYEGDSRMTYSLLHGEGILAGRELLTEPWVIIEYPRNVSPEVLNLLAARGYAQVAHFRGWVDWTNGDVLVYHRRAP